MPHRAILAYHHAATAAQARDAARTPDIQPSLRESNETLGPPWHAFPGVHRLAGCSKHRCHMHAPVPCSAATYASPDPAESLLLLLRNPPPATIMRAQPSTEVF